ncbi:MAG: hypothetical protein ACLGIA_09035 [Actinomycetes bacterium]
MSEDAGRRESAPQEGLGKTGGLPGANADPRASELTDQERESTVAGGDVSPEARAAELDGEIGS